MTNNTVLFQKILHQSGHLSTVHGVSTISQIAGTAALNECEQWLDHFLQHLHRMRDLVVQKLNLIPGVQCIAPEGCYVAFADIRETGMSSTQIHELLLQRARVAVVPGLPQWFGPGAEGYIRISFASSEQILSESLSRIHQTLSRL
jgi:bifunctional pyridoxal-dependent enzyme with beta-cystathionase and maltose regulon repressor activities